MSEPFIPPYPDWDVLSKWDSPSFDDITRAVLHRRLNQVPGRRFFTLREWPTLKALCDCVIPQDERRDTVPLARWIDATLHDWHGNGTRHADMPPDPDAWRQGLAALEAEAQMRDACAFSALDRPARAALLCDVDKGEIRAPEWQTLPPQRFLRKLVLSEITAIYYSHPIGQSEIGFGGPASPRGYVRLDANRTDSWESPPGNWGENHKR